jgi:hypothetical protein
MHRDRQRHVDLFCGGHFMATQKVMNVLSNQAALLESWPASLDSALPGLQLRPKAMLLGLPCARCKAYFGADLKVCPICGCGERVVTGKRAAKVVVM